MPATVFLPVEIRPDGTMLPLLRANGKPRHFRWYRHALEAVLDTEKTGNEAIMLARRIGDIYVDANDGAVICSAE